MFQLDERLANDTFQVKELPLCDVRLMNDAQFPWVILVPKVADAREIYQLTEAQQQQLLRESAMVCSALETLFSPTKLNVAALGNVVAQLHIHHIARFQNDCAWPNPVWGRQPTVAYSEEQREERLQALRHLLS